jgi:D-sorbitol dehydrogenase (acceptor)
MIEQGRGGRIVNLASQAGRRGEALVLAYCASKAAVISMTQSMALALAPHRITVNAVAPGVVDTPFWEEVDRQFARLLDLPVGEPKRRAVAGIPLGRIEQPEDVAAAVAFLVSPDADYITQQCLNVDGGNWPG